MNIDRDLVARSLSKAGEEPITDAEWEEGTSNRVRVVKDFFHATVLEALSTYDWTSQKKRARLEEFLIYEEVATPSESDKGKYYILDENENYIKAYTWDNQTRTYTPAWDPTKTYYIIDDRNIIFQSFFI